MSLEASIVHNLISLPAFILLFNFHEDHAHDYTWGKSGRQSAASKLSSLPLLVLPALVVLAVTLAQSWVCRSCHHHFHGTIQFLLE